MSGRRRPQAAEEVRSMEELGCTSCKRKAQSLRCEVREHRGDKKQGQDISVEVMDMHRINYGLDCHDQAMHDA
jgi:hypothetical protein